jgi:hypothetical protein
VTGSSDRKFDRGVPCSSGLHFSMIFSDLPSPAEAKIVL